MTTDDPQSFNHPVRRTLDQTDVESLGKAVLALTHEVWTLTDRLYVAEALLLQKGIVSPDEIERFQPDASLQDRLNAQGIRLVENITGALAGRS